MEVTTEQVAQNEAQRKALIKGRLKRYREESKLTQADVAEKLGVSQPTVAKLEREGRASEEILTKLWRIYGINEQYPNAPKDPEKRREWFDKRNEGIRSYKPSTQTIGARQ